MKPYKLNLYKQNINVTTYELWCLMNLLSCIEKVLIINYMTQLTIYFFLDNFLCVFDKCGLFTLAIFSNSVSGVLLEGRGWEVEGRKRQHELHL